MKEIDQTNEKTGTLVSRVYGLHLMVKGTKH